jgi:hypothetical protein
MMETSTARVENAWKIASAWITDFNGNANQAYLLNIPLGRFAPGLAVLSAQTHQFRISLIPKGELDADFVTYLNTFEEAAEAIVRKDTAALNIDYTAMLDGLEIEIHTIVDRTPSNALTFDLVWWPDQAFPEGEDPRPRFDKIMHFFIRLQELFSAKRLYISPETPEKPAPGSVDWVEI